MSKFLSLAIGFSMALGHFFPQVAPAKAEESALKKEQMPKIFLGENGKYIVEQNTIRPLKTEFVEIIEEIKPPQVVAGPIIQRQTAGVEQWRPLVAKYFPANQVDNALKIMACESRGNPNAVSRTNDHGLMQIHKGLAIHGQKIYDPEFNIQLAYNNYYKTRGWQPWTCRRKVNLN